MKPDLPKDLARPLGQLGGRRFHVAERVVEAEPFPLVPAHLVERQHFHALDVAKPGRELRRLRQIGEIVGQPRHQHEANPHRPPARREPPRELERRPDSPFP